MGPAVVLLLVAGAAGDASGPCFDFDRRIVDPLRPSIPLLEGRDNSSFGTYTNGVDWASTRAVLAMPLRTAYAQVLDHRTQKDMKKTELATRVEQRPGYLQYHLVDVVVTLRLLLFKTQVAWTEAWAYALVDGTEEDPRRIVVSYQKVAGTRHIQRECGSYVLEARDGATDISLYEEVKADRRTARDTRDMHAGILANIRRMGRQP